jgi:tetratricopeptide (TPR) repeat protein
VLAPNYAQAHYSYADTLHPDDSINEVKEAISLDPLSPLFHSGLAEALLAIGQFDDAVRQLKTVFELDPKFAVAHGTLGEVYTQEGRYKEAIQEFQIEQRLGGNFELGRIGYAYARLGNEKRALRVLSTFPSTWQWWNWAWVTKEKAIACLQKLADEHEEDSLLFLSTDHVFDPLRTDPRFQDIVRKVNLPS